MKVVLLKKVPKIGEEGDAVDVADGYALNFLLPQKLAEKANPANLARAEKIRSERVAKREEILKDAKKFADKLTGITLKFKRKVAKNKLFGGVSEKDIVEALAQEAKMTVDRKQVKMAHHLKELGAHEVEVHLAENFNVKVKVEIIAE